MEKFLGSVGKSTSNRVAVIAPSTDARSNSIRERLKGGLSSLGLFMSQFSQDFRFICFSL